MRTLLLTGFEPFGGETTNPSLEAVKKLDGYTTGDIVVRSIELPVSWDRITPTLAAALEVHSPAFVISVGQAGGRAQIAVERIGINICIGKDNYGISRDGEAVILGAPDGYFSSLPVIPLANAMHLAGIPAHVSNTAGTYLCNYTLYTLEHLIRSGGLPIQATFIHIPFLPEQTTDKANHSLPSMSLATVVLGLRAAINCLTTLAQPTTPHRSQHGEVSYK